MNAFFFTGYLTEEAVRRVRPTSNEIALTFKFCTRDARGKEIFLHAFVDDASLVNEYEPLLTSGRAVILHGDVTTVPYMKHGIVTGQMETFHVSKAEFPNRGGKKTTEEDEEEAAATKEVP